MNDPILTLTLAIILVCNLGVVWLYWKIYQWTRTPAEIYSLMVDIRKQNNKILRRIAQVKTRLADEERDDQRRKRQARRKRS